MRPAAATDDLDVEVAFERYLGADDSIVRFLELLSTGAPRWCSRLAIWRSDLQRIPLDIADPQGAQSTILQAAAERGPTYQALVKKFGRGEERLAGSVELRGVTPDLVVVISVDEKPQSRLANRVTLPNSVVFQIRGRSIEGTASVEWAKNTFEMLCDHLSPTWGSAHHIDEYWAKVMSPPPRVMALGRDFASFLPGIFWLNFFGEPYCALIGRDRLRNARAYRVTDVDSGVLIQIAEKPDAWASPEYEKAAKRLLGELGEEYFFDRSRPERKTKAPSWS